MRVAERNQLLGTHDDHGICPLDLRHHTVNGLFNRRGIHALAGNHVGDDFGVDCRLENAALPGQLLVKFIGVSQVAVVCNCQCALHIAHNQRLGVFADTGTGSGIPHVPHRHLPDQTIQRFMAEHLGNKAHVFGAGNNTAVVHSNSTAFLPTMLEGQQSVVGGIRRIYGAVGINPEDTAFLVKMPFLCSGDSPAVHPFSFHYRPILFITS